MDHSYGAIDDTVLKAGPAVLPPLHHNYPPIDSLPMIKPTIIGSNMQLSHTPTAFFDRIKCEEMAADMSGTLSRSAAHVQLYDKSQQAETVRYSSTLGVDLRGLMQSSTPVPSCVPVFDVMDFIASSNSFNFLASTDVMQMGSSNSNISTSVNYGLGMHVMHEQAGHANGMPHMNSMMGTSSLSDYYPKGNMVKQALVPNHFPPGRNKGPSADNAQKLGFCRSSERHLVSTDSLSRYSDAPDSPHSPSKQESVVSAEDLDTDWQKSQIQTSKRRKTQQKRIIRVPVGDAKHLKGETPPSDLWAWRKYGQKPIKGSPYPRGYYRCSSSKGCSARKQVERSCSDPTMLIVTYTSDHNHEYWPVSKTNSVNAQVTQTPLLSNDKDGVEEHQSDEVATTTSSCEVVNENLFSSIINYAPSIDDQVANSSLDVSFHDGEESFSLKRDVDLCLSASRTSISPEEDHGVFDDLGELPEMSSIFSKGYLDDQKHVDDGWFVH